MGISGISGSGYTQAVDPNELFKTWADKKLRGSGDWVTISDEGREKADELAKVKRETMAGLPGMENIEDAQAENSGNTNSSSAVSQSPEEQMEDLEAKIKALMDQLMSIMQSALPLEQKMQQSQPIQQMISQLQVQLNEIKTQVLKEKTA
jgi:hypothetical protein